MSPFSTCFNIGSCREASASECMVTFQDLCAVFAEQRSKKTPPANAPLIPGHWFRLCQWHGGGPSLEGSPFCLKRMSVPAPVNQAQSVSQYPGRQAGFEACCRGLLAGQGNAACQYDSVMSLETLCLPLDHDVAVAGYSRASRNFGWDC